MAFLTPARSAPISFSLIPPTGSTMPRKLTSPVMARSLWMGVPVLTLAGDSFLSRQGLGLLVNAGLPEWVASDADDYHARAVRLASDLPRLADIRGHLRDGLRASPLFDAPRFARHFETALWGMWHEKKPSAPP